MAVSPQEILQKYWGYSSFIHPQLLIIQSILNGKDTFALLPTGGGKSLTFQVPIMMMDGVCIVVSPLIALMKDQVKNLKEKGIKAATISSELTKLEIESILDNARFGKLKILYISPERLQSLAFQQSLKTLNIQYFAIDEAHCIIEWGFDFRPSYLALKHIKELFPDTPILGLTATATPKAQSAIMAQLGLIKANVYKKSLQRQNIAYRVANSKDKWKDISYLLNKNKGSTIIFCKSRKDTYQLTKFLVSSGFDADYYHARLSTAEKNRRQKLFIESDSKILVSTNAFGMGIDKPNVRLVIHETMPNSIESYFQEVGRAGRDGKSAIGILLYDKKDKKNAIKIFKTAHPDRDSFIEIIRKLYTFFQIAESELRHGQLPFSEKKFRQKFNLSKQRTKNVLQYLQQKQILTIHKTQRQSLVKINVKNYEVIHDKSNEGIILNFVARHYGGIFKEPIPIDEHYMAHKINLPSHIIKKSLKNLSEVNKIYYRDASTVKISFLVPRDDNEIRVTLWKDFYSLQKVKWERLQTILYFAENDMVCKSKLLLSYFGEKHTAKCGICNVCQQDDNLHEPCEKDLLNYIAQFPRTIYDLENKFIEMDRKLIHKQLQLLLDEEEIKLKLPNTYYI